MPLPADDLAIDEQVVITRRSASASRSAPAGPDEATSAPAQNRPAAEAMKVRSAGAGGADSPGTSNMPPPSVSRADEAPPSPHPRRVAPRIPPSGEPLPVSSGERLTSVPPTRHVSDTGAPTSSGDADSADGVQPRAERTSAAPAHETPIASDAASRARPGEVSAGLATSRTTQQELTPAQRDRTWLADASARASDERSRTTGRPLGSPSATFTERPSPTDRSERHPVQRQAVERASRPEPTPPQRHVSDHDGGGGSARAAEPPPAAREPRATLTIGRVEIRIVNRPIVPPPPAQAATSTPGESLPEELRRFQLLP